MGRALILAGVLVWAVFAAASLAGADPDPGRYLAYHLGGVVPGALLVRWRRNQ